jgi:16S rRNA (cytosine967-C5)-methyltransferase
MVAAFLDVKPGMRVVDTSAGAGGKTLHMAALMENKDY